MKGRGGRREGKTNDVPCFVNSKWGEKEKG